MMKNRRELIKGIGLGSVWSTPVIQSIVLPAHAQTSPGTTLPNNCPGIFTAWAFSVSGGPVSPNSTFSSVINFLSSDFIPVVTYTIELNSQPANPEFEVILNPITIVTSAVNESTSIPFSIIASSSYDGSPDAFLVKVTTQWEAMNIDGCEVNAASLESTVDIPIFGVDSSNSLNPGPVTRTREYQL